MNYEALVKAVYPEAECWAYEGHSARRRNYRIENDASPLSDVCSTERAAWESAYLTEQQKQKAKESVG